MMPDVNCYVTDMPHRIPAFVISNPDGSYTIMLNARHTREQQLISYHHEMSHILNGDYEKRNADWIELTAHESGSWPDPDS